MRTLGPSCAAVLLTATTSACFPDPFACRTEARSLDATAALSGEAVVPPSQPADTGSAFVSFLQFRGHDTQQSLTWFIRGAAGSVVAGLHIHRGGAGENGSMVYEFTNGYSGPEDVISQSGPQVWSGKVGYQELFDLIRNNRAYVDIHTEARPDGALRGQLRVTRESDWQTACTD